jgi:hypothetical protein
MTSTELSDLLRAWITSTRWGLLDALVALKLAEEGRENKAKRTLVLTLRTVDELAALPNHEDYVPGS